MTQTAEARAVASPPATRRRSWVPYAALTVAIAIPLWPILSLAPVAGLDPSWNIALYLFHTEGMQVGEDVLFTYGPLGFLSKPLAVGWRVWPAVVYTLAVHVCFVGTMLILLRRRYSWATSALVAAGATSLYIVEPVELATILVSLWAIAWPAGAISHRLTPWLAPVGGTVAGLQLMVKFNAGAVALAVAGLAVLVASDRLRRDLVALGGAFAASAVLLWVLAAGSLAHLPSWLRGSIEVTAGYSSAMAEEVGRLQAEYLLLVLLLSALVLMKRHAIWPQARRPALVAALVMFAVWAQFKHGFVRHEPYHSIVFFIFLALLPMAMTWVPSRRHHALAVSVIALAVLIPSYPSGARTAFEEMASRPGSIAEMRALVDGARMEELRRDARRDIHARLELDGTSVAYARGHGVHVDPVETAAIWAYDLDWAPVPVFQSYSAYTVDLDRRNAEVLADPDGPDRILRSRWGLWIDGRNPMFESPAYTLAVVCNFEQLHAGAVWQVLGRIPDRCGVPRALGSIRVEARGEVAVPQAAPGEVVVASIEQPAPWWEPVARVLFKPPRRATIELEGVPFRFVQGTAEAPHVLCLPAAAGYDPVMGWAGCPRTLRMLTGGSYEVSFYAVPLGTQTVTAGLPAGSSGGAYSGRATTSAMSPSQPTGSRTSATRATPSASLPRRG